MKKRIYGASMLAIFRNKFINNHSKFIHGSPLKKEDLDKEFKHDGKTLVLVGMNDNEEFIAFEPKTNFHWDIPMKTPLTIK